jgi:hypothetical protein
MMKKRHLHQSKHLFDAYRENYLLPLILLFYFTVDKLFTISSFSFELKLCRLSSAYDFWLDEDSVAMFEPLARYCHFCIMSRKTVYTYLYQKSNKLLPNFHH